MSHDFKTYRNKLEVELGTLKKELETLGYQNPQVQKDWVPTTQDTDVREPDENVRADRAEDLEERTATLAVLETRYNNINRALKKISDGTFGSCEICQNNIEIDRLDANPAARTCKTHLNDEVSLTD